MNISKQKQHTLLRTGRPVKFFCAEIIPEFRIKFDFNFPIMEQLH